MLKKDLEKQVFNRPSKYAVNLLFSRSRLTVLSALVTIAVTLALGNIEGCDKPESAVEETRP